MNTELSAWLGKSAREAVEPWTGALAVHEAGHGLGELGPFEYRTTAEKDGDAWVLRGEKLLTANADGAARVLLAACTLPGGETGLFFVPADLPGVEVRTEGDDPSGPGPARGAARFDGARVPLRFCACGPEKSRDALSTCLLLEHLGAAGAAAGALTALAARLRGAKADGPGTGGVLADADLCLMAERWMAEASRREGALRDTPLARCLPLARAANARDFAVSRAVDCFSRAREIPGEDSWLKRTRLGLLALAALPGAGLAGRAESERGYAEALVRGW
jgi:alkylation response protein AidB-like acyl-CoA dehydrogenase